MRFFYITLLIFGAILLVPSFAFAAPSECPAIEYVEIVDADGTSGDDFITISDGNSINIDGKGGNDCIVVGDNNTGVILGGTGADVLIAGNTNSGKIKGEGGSDTVVVGNNNSGNVLGGTDVDNVIVGNNNSGQVESEGGDDIVVVGNDNSGNVSGGTGTDAITIGNNNSGQVVANGGDDTITIGDSNSGFVEGDTGIDKITIGNNNSGDVELNGGNDVLNIGQNNAGNILGGTGDDAVTVGENNSGNITGDGGDDTLIHQYGNTGVIDVENIISIPPAPSASPLPGTFNSTQEITLSSDGAESILYTTDGTTPNCNEDEEMGMLYETPVSVLSTKTITAVACTEDGEYFSPIASLSYTIELKTNSADLSSILEAVFTPAPGESLSLTQSLTVSQDLEINTTASGSKVILVKDTIITRAGSGSFDASTLTSSETDVGSLAGLAEGQIFEAALQWGIPNITLQFDPAITISIFVGTDLNGQTLDVVRSVDGTDGWTNDGIVPPATCLIAEGICSFQATKASFYAATTEPEPEPEPAPNPVSSGGGSLWFPQLYNPVSTTVPAPASNNNNPTESAPVSPEPVLKTTPVVVAVVPKKVAKAKISKIQPTPQPTKIIEQSQQPETAKKNLLSNIFSAILSIFHWPF